MSDEVVDIIVELNTSLPQFDEYMALFPGKHELQWALQDLFVDYLSFCVTAVQYFKRGTARKRDLLNISSLHPLIIIQETSLSTSSRVLLRQTFKRVKIISKDISSHSDRLQSSFIARTSVVNISKSSERLGPTLQNCRPNLLKPPK